MKKVKAAEGEICVAVSRFGHDPIPVCLPKGATVEEVLDKAEVELDGREEVFVAGTKADYEDIVEDKDVLSVVTPKAAGSR